MSQAEGPTEGLNGSIAGKTSFLVRKMRWEDVEQVKAIDLVCFPTMLPPTNYKTEFINPMAHYLVACSDSSLETTADTARLNPLVAGFIGLWYLAGEIHIINLAVHPDYRRTGLGELLLIKGIELSVGLKAILMTLEVRVSNFEARALYTKFGFTERGVRRAYYLDNREDAAIMTIEGMDSSAYQQKLQQLKRMWVEKTGMSLETPEP